MNSNSLWKNAIRHFGVLGLWHRQAADYRVAKRWYESKGEIMLMAGLSVIGLNLFIEIQNPAVTIFLALAVSLLAFLAVRASYRTAQRNICKAANNYAGYTENQGLKQILAWLHRHEPNKLSDTWLSLLNCEARGSFPTADHAHDYLELLNDSCNRANNLMRQMRVVSTLEEV